VTNTKTYDGDTSAAATPTVSGVQVGDSVTGLVETYVTKTAGTGKTLSVSAYTVNDGNGGNNYTVSTVAETTGAINQAGLTASITADTKVYDGTTAAVFHCTLDGVIGSDDVSCTGGAATFADKNIGTSKTVTATGLGLNGVDAVNYSVNSSATTNADITALHITGAFTAANKVYDGNTSAAVLTRSTVGDVGGVSLTGGTATFSDKNAGTGKTLTLTGATLTGADAGNYILDSVATTTANITARALVVTPTGINKIYDGNTSATVTLSDNRVSGDNLTTSYSSASFNDKNVGNNKPVSVSGISISGADSANYSFNTTGSTTADITARALTVTATGVNKTYDGTPSATVNLSDDRISGDVFTDGYSSASFNNKNVGTGKPVSVSGISISGTDAGNYTFNTNASTTANITQRALTVTATGVNKVYDGTTTATVALSDNRVSGDVFTDSYTSALFSDKNVGTNKTVSASGIAISGIDAGNYTFNTTASTTANITARPITVTADAKTKILNAADPAFTYQVTGGSLVSGDSFSGALTRTAGESIGTYPILQGTLTAGSNYNLAYLGANLQIVFVSAGSCLGDAGHQVLQPVNVDGSSVWKQGSTVPVKFRVCDANGNSIGAGGISSVFNTSPTGSNGLAIPVLYMVINGAVTVDETALSTANDPQFRWDSSAQQWIFNLSTKNLTANKTYYYHIYLLDGTAIDFKFGLK
jgi:hypothetical protein